MELNDDKTVPIRNWRKNKCIQRLLEAHLFKDAKVIEVNLKIYHKKRNLRKKYAEVVYQLGEKLYRAELKLRDDRHWDTRRRDGKSDIPGKGSSDYRPYFTSSDLLGEEGVSETV